MLLNAIIWNFDPIAFNIGSMEIRWYSLLFALAFIVSYLILKKFVFDKENIPVNYLDKLAFYIFIGVFIGARLGHCLFYEFSYYSNHIAEMILPIKQTEDGIKLTGYQGLASHGGAIGILIAVWIYYKKTGLPMLWTLDRLVIIVALAGVFIRLGNLANSEIYGIATNSDWGFIFVRDHDFIPKHPTQLYEAGAYLLCFTVLFFLFLKRKDSLAPGFLFSLFLILVFSFRFIIESVKEVQEAWEADMMLNMGQILSIPFILLGIVILIMALKRMTGKRLDVSKLKLTPDKSNKKK